MHKAIMDIGNDGVWQGSIKWNIRNPLVERAAHNSTCSLLCPFLSSGGAMSSAWAMRFETQIYFDEHIEALTEHNNQMKVYNNSLLFEP